MPRSKAPTLQQPEIWARIIQPNHVLYSITLSLFGFCCPLCSIFFWHTTLSCCEKSFQYAAQKISIQMVSCQQEVWKGGKGMLGCEAFDALDCVFTVQYKQIWHNNWYKNEKYREICKILPFYRCQQLLYWELAHTWWQPWHLDTSD